MHGASATDQRFRHAWAKAPRQWSRADDETMGPQWLPLHVHLTDTAAIAGRLCWIASSTELFPLVPQFQQVSTTPQERADRAWQRLGLPRRWLPASKCDTTSATDLLRTRFPGLAHATANPVQEGTVDAARRMTEPGLLIIEAVMGVGKTEASLLAAEIMADKFGMSGVTQTAAGGTAATTTRPPEPRTIVVSVTTTPADPPTTGQVRDTATVASP